MADLIKKYWDTKRPVEKSQASKPYIPYNYNEKPYAFKEGDPRYYRLVQPSTKVLVEAGQAVPVNTPFEQQSDHSGSDGSLDSSSDSD